MGSHSSGGSKTIHIPTDLQANPFTSQITQWLMGSTEQFSTTPFSCYTAMCLLYQHEDFHNLAPDHPKPALSPAVTRLSGCPTSLSRAHPVRSMQPHGLWLFLPAPGDLNGAVPLTSSPQRRRCKERQKLKLDLHLLCVHQELRDKQVSSEMRS